MKEMKLKHILLIFVLIIISTSVFFIIVDTKPPRTYYDKFKLDISNVLEPFEIYLPVAIISSFHSPPPINEGKPISLYNSLEIISGKGDFNIISLNNTYYLYVISNGNISLGFDITSNKPTKDSTYSKWSTDDVYLNNSCKTSVYVDFFIFSRFSGSDADFGFEFEGEINHGWQTIGIRY